ncbi:NADP oxidoreductase [Mycobacterium malmoense]|uniref:NADP oxidoreductase n=1 Tax=Mycobacterium malmoense TaxID=1780 RepID=A0ABX3STZ3_MYCMA|nr:NADP oxidoreductase [Mycobacterium malmoense]OIN78926.1 NADP oxidoreductase [Mycobacterium malmoense]ORA83678.1 NADP oxidoreductase [Mycobacterium malmoense]QZA18793.1 NADP oxidoreductase [Mycobacterium malmoense]UNB95563.1 NADP oxidoreductase [Mycobacterium malmoense]
MTTSGTNEIASHELPATPLDPELAAKRAGKIKVSMISLCGCWGCTLSLLDIDERMIALLDKITILRSSFTDIKRIPQRCHIGFIEGGVANEDNIETLRHFRDNCDVLISVGACAIWGGVPSLRNMVGLKDCLAEAYTRSPTAPPGSGPVVPYDKRIPILTNDVYPCHEVVHMDYFIPGCPPSANAILDVLEDLVNGRPVKLPKSLNHFD